MAKPSLPVHCLPLRLEWAWLGTSDLGRSWTPAPLAWNPQMMPLTLRRSGMLREKGRGAPYFTVGKAKVIQGGLGFGPQSQGLEALGWRVGPLGSALPESPGHQDTPGGNPGHMWGLEALPRKQAQLAPDPASSTVASPPPGHTGEKHVTQGLAPRSFSLTSPCHPTPGREPIGCARASGRGLSGSVPQRPLGLQRLPCASHWVTSQPAPQVARL